jgi:hypothetical protein
MDNLDYLKPVMEMMMETLPPSVITILTIMGALRLALKPIMSLIEIYVKLSPSKKDDVIPEKIMQSKAYKTLAYILDLVGSVKIPKKKEDK